MVDSTQLLKVIEQVYNATKIHLTAETNPDIIEGMNISLDLMESALIDAGILPRKEHSHVRPRRPTLQRLR